MSDYYVVEPCKSAGGVEIKLRDRRIDLKKAERALSQHGEVAGSSAVVLLAAYKGHSLSLYASGRIMVKGKKIDIKTGEGLAKELVSVLEARGAIL